MSTIVHFDLETGGLDWREMLLIFCVTCFIAYLFSFTCAGTCP